MGRGRWIWMCNCLAVCPHSSRAHICIITTIETHVYLAYHSLKYCLLSWLTGFVLFKSVKRHPWNSLQQPRLHVCSHSFRFHTLSWQHITKLYQCILGGSSHCVVYFLLNKWYNFEVLWLYVNEDERWWWHKVSIHNKTEEHADSRAECKEYWYERYLRKTWNKIWKKHMRLFFKGNKEKGKCL